LLQAVAPAAIEVALAVQEEIAARIEQAEALRRAQIEQARRRYLQMSPEHRLVADALEADWNTKLRHLDALECEHERTADEGLLSEQARQRILALAQDFQHVWNDPSTEPLERKRMVALLIEDVTLLKAEQVAVHVRFRGGRTTSLAVERPKPIALVRKTRPEVVETLDRLLETHTDHEVAAALNTLGHCNWQGQAFTAKKVALVRRTYGLKSRFERLRARGLLIGVEMGQRLGVSSTTVHTLGRAGRLRRQPLRQPRALPLRARGGCYTHQGAQRGRTRHPPPSSPLHRHHRRQALALSRGLAARAGSTATP
jgi:hypothetical protein